MAYFVNEEEVYLREELAVIRPAEGPVIEASGWQSVHRSPIPRQAIPLLGLPCLIRC